MSKEEHTLEEKVDYLENLLGYRPIETELHAKEGMGSFEWEVNQDFRVLLNSKYNEWCHYAGMPSPNAYKIGHEVYIEGATSMAGGMITESVIEATDVKYNEDTGEPFYIYLIEGRWWTDGGHGAGGPYKSNYMYDVIYDEEKWLKYLSK